MIEKLSIFIPLHNDITYIRDTVLSCIGEAGAIYIYDNASTDGSGDVCAKLALQFPSVKHIRREENIGAFNNMRDAVANCTTPYFCFLGAHDKLTPGYAQALLEELEASPETVLVCGTIQHIDEQGNNLPQVTRAHWINATRHIASIDRAGAFVKKLRDCFLFYGVIRTDVAKKVWPAEATLGFDRLMIVRLAAHGKIAYVPEATFLARDFPVTRDSKKDRERRAQSLAGTEISKSNFSRNHAIAKIVLELAHDDESLTKAFSTLEVLNRRLHNRRYYQRRRIVIAIVILGAFIGLILFLHACTPQ